MNRIDLLEALRRTQVLQQLPLGALDRLLSQATVETFPAAAALIEEGAHAKDVLLLLDGRAAVRLAISEGEGRVVAIRGAGEFVGEMALVDELPRSATVTAQDPVTALRIPRIPFLEAIGAHPRASLDLLRVLSLRLRESDAAQIEALRAKAEKLASANRRLSRENRHLRQAFDQRFGFEAFVGSSPAAERVRAAARRAAESDLPVLLVGETGTGKELLARAIHAGGARGARPFVALNCALFSEALLESELFGHARGSFTGASANKPGLVEAAEGGTLFLDELAEMPRPIQAALLRFLELGEFRRLGETQVRHATVRIIAATSLGVDEALASGRVRLDLHYRLDVFRIEIPPLRQRREDIPELVAEIAAEVAERLECAPLRFSADALTTLEGRSAFDGNVRQLRNEIERLYAMRDGGALVEARDLSERMRSPESPPTHRYADSIRAFKQNLLRGALVRNDGNRSAAARELGLHPSNLIRMMRDLGIDVPSAVRRSSAV